MCSPDLVNVQGGVVDALGWGSPLLTNLTNYPVLYQLLHSQREKETKYKQQSHEKASTPYYLDTARPSGSMQWHLSCQFC